MVRFERLLPGEGGIDLVNLFAALPETLPIGVEIPNVARVAIVGYEAWATQALSAAKLRWLPLHWHATSERLR